MKTLKLALYFLPIFFLATSCETNEEREADRNVYEFSKYVDSVSTINTSDLKQNWENIEKTYTEKKLQAQSSVEAFGSRPKLNVKINQANSKYKQFRKKFQIEVDKFVNSKRKITFANSFFEGDEMTDGMKFNWVNKANIASVYENFVDSVFKNKNNYSRQDWDEVNLIFDSLEKRKNILEEEGLAMSEELKIEQLKIKFSSLYTLDSIIIK
ncbi:DUF6565 domain-containing protein [Flavobacterium sp.]